MHVWFSRQNVSVEISLGDWIVIDLFVRPFCGIYFRTTGTMRIFSLFRPWKSQVSLWFEKITQMKEIDAAEKSKSL